MPDAKSEGPRHTTRPLGCYPYDVPRRHCAGRTPPARAAEAADPTRPAPVVPPPYQRAWSPPAGRRRRFRTFRPTVDLAFLGSGTNPARSPHPHTRKEPGMTPSQLPWSLRTQQTAAAFYRAGYPVEEIADAIGITSAEC